MDHTPINLAQIYQTSVSCAFIPDEAAHQRYIRRLRNAGFILSPYKEAYYHPKHWAVQDTKGYDNAESTWLFNDSFTWLTKDAKRWLNQEIHKTTCALSI
jgi:hypothetical protein